MLTVVLATTSSQPALPDALQKTPTQPCPRRSKAGPDVTSPTSSPTPPLHSPHTCTIPPPYHSASPPASTSATPASQSAGRLGSIWEFCRPQLARLARSAGHPFTLTHFGSVDRWICSYIWSYHAGIYSSIFCTSASCRVTYLACLTSCHRSHCLGATLAPTPQSSH